jgi:hypothetical protein
MSVPRDPQCANKIQAKLCKVGKILIAKPVLIKGRVDMTKAPQLPQASAVATNIGKVDSKGVPYKHLLNLTAAVDKDSHLPRHVLGNPSKMTSQFWANDRISRNLPLERSFECTLLAGLEAADITGNLDVNLRA